MITISGAGRAWTAVYGNRRPGSIPDLSTRPLGRVAEPAPLEWWVRRTYSGGPHPAHLVSAKRLLAHQIDFSGGRVRLRSDCLRDVNVTDAANLELAEAPGRTPPDDWRTCPDCRNAVGYPRTSADITGSRA